MSEPMTIYGYTKIENELKHLKQIERPNIVREIDIARSHCYLKKTIDAEAFKKIQSCYMKPVTKMFLTWPFISCSLREKVV